MSNDSEIIKLSCDKCQDIASEGTYEELFPNVPNLMLLPGMKCKCGGDICLEFTGRYKETDSVSTG